MQLSRIDGCESSPAKPVEELKENIKISLKSIVPDLRDSTLWRVNKPIALVGGGPSLKKTIRELKDYQHIMVCGSAHDYVVRQGYEPEYCVICDPDAPIMLKYLQEKNDYTTYMIASQCPQEIFDYFEGHKRFMWHAAGDILPEDFFGKPNTRAVVGGGCTVGTRAMVVALGMGFNDLHLYGFDSCLEDDYTHHAYSFATAEESVGDIREIKLDIPGSKMYKVAGYMLAQMFDFQKVVEMYSKRMNVTVHGDSLLKELFEASKEISQRIMQNGNKS